MNRREALKLFGIGATVVPIIGATPVLEAAGQLVQPAKVSLIKLGKLVEPIDLGRVTQASIMLTMDDGSTRMVDMKGRGRGYLKPGPATEVSISALALTSPASADGWWRGLAE